MTRTSRKKKDDFASMDSLLGSDKNVIAEKQLQAKAETTQAKAEATKAEIQKAHNAEKIVANEKAQRRCSNISNVAKDIKNDNELANLLAPVQQITAGGVNPQGVVGLTRNVPLAMGHALKRADELEKLGRTEEAERYRKLYKELEKLNNMLPELMKLNVFDAPGWKVTVEQQRFNEWYNDVFVDWKLYSNLTAAELTPLKTF